jgi:proteasome assembly chaperone (PAC2) family protein
LRFLSEPLLNKPDMIAAWPGMGYLAKISADYIKRRLKAKKFAEISYYHNALVYNNGLAEIVPIKHRFFYSDSENLIICVGDAQPSTPEESIILGEKILEVAMKYEVQRIFTMAAYPNEYVDDPQVYGVYTHEHLKPILEEKGVTILEGEGTVNGLNGVMIGLGLASGIEGICLMGDIKYANVPQHLSSKAVLEVLINILNIDIDTSQLEKRAKKIDENIKQRLDIQENEIEEISNEEKKFGYIS